MELKDIKAIIDLMRKNDLSVFEMEKDGFRLKLQKGGEQKTVFATPQMIAAPMAPAVIPEPKGAAAAPPAASSEPAAVPGKEITSPMVGTFYRAASPESPPFVDLGQEVNEDTVVCIIEAMKVMNEIKAETKGVISQVLVDNAKPVEFGQPLFKIRPI